MRLLTNGPLRIDFERLEVSVNGKLVTLAGLQLKLLVHLARHPDWVLTRSQLLSAVWGEGSHRNPKSVDVMVCRLRNRLGPSAGALIEGVRAFGYRLRLADDHLIAPIAGSGSKRVTGGR